MRDPQDLLIEMTTLWMSSFLVANARLARMWWPATPASQAETWHELFVEKAEAAGRVQIAATRAALSGLDAVAIAEASLVPVTRTVETNLRAITQPSTKSGRSRRR